MWIWFILWQIIGASLTNRLVKWLAVVTTVGLLTSHFPFFPISFHLSFVLHPLSLHSLFPLFPFISLWLVESIGMQGDVGWCLQGKDKAVISANEATLVPEHKCANISNTTRPCVCVCVCVCVCENEREKRVTSKRSDRGHCLGHECDTTAFSLVHWAGFAIWPQLSKCSS